MNFIIAAGISVLILAGCASFGGNTLVPGKSTAAEVEALMGAPAGRLERPNGETDLYFSRLPAGRAMYVARIGPDGALKSIEQRLVRENIGKIVAGAWTKKEVRELLGPPGKSGHFSRQRREWWEYRFIDIAVKRVLWVQFSEDGVVREVLDMLDPTEYRPAGG
jgi:hypothetical protein